MQVFLVRHGETDGNIAHRHQIEKTPLTKRGKEQAKAVAEELKTFSPTHLLTSKLVRAIDTAHVIGDELGLMPETSQNFVELERPANLYGRYHRSVYSLLFYARWYFGLTKSTDGETYKMLRDRFLMAKEELAKYPEDARVVVVSHAAFMNLFIAHLCQPEPLWPHQAFKTFMDILTMKNGEVIRLEYNSALSSGKNKSCAWQVVSR